MSACASVAAALVFGRSVMSICIISAALVCSLTSIQSIHYNCLLLITTTHSNNSRHPVSSITSRLLVTDPEQCFSYSSAWSLASVSLTSDILPVLHTLTDVDSFTTLISSRQPPFILHHRPSTIHHRPSTTDHRPSPITANHFLLPANHQPPTLDLPPSLTTKRPRSYRLHTPSSS